MAKFKPKGVGSGLVGAGVAPNQLTQSDPSKLLAATVAAKYSLNPETLWGIYGTESSFGTNSSTSSTGAQGPMQFEPGTWAQYGNGGNVQSLHDAMWAAGRYLHSLGANDNTSSPQTIAAVNAYNGNGGGANPNTSYYQSVLKFGGQFGGSGPAQDAANAIGGAVGSVVGGLAQGFLGLSGDIAGQLALVAVGLVKDGAVGIYDLVLAPWWHWNQRAVDYYWAQILTDTEGKHWTALPWSAVFWGVGYWLLWTDPNTKGLRPAPVRRSRLAHHVRALQAVPARQSLVKPKDVKSKTPTKPPAVISKAVVTQTGTLRATRHERVQVHGTRIEPGTPANIRARTLQRAEESHANPPGSESHAHNRAGRGSLPNSAGAPNGTSQPRSRARNKP